jgi:hypothetical protein
MPDGVRTKSGAFSSSRSRASQILTVGCTWARALAARETLRVS